MWIIRCILQLETFPCLDIAHNLLAAVELRNELGNNRKTFPSNNPFASWLLTVAFIFSGSLTANLLLGQPVIAPLGNTKQLLVASIIWFLVNFTSDIAYKAATSFPVKIVASTINEIYRARKVVNGILQASQIYPDSWVIMMAIATIRANGSGLMKLLIRLIRKTQTPSDAGFMQPSFSTKISILAAFFLVAEKRTSYFGSFELLHFVVMLFFVYIKVSALCGVLPEKRFPVKNWFSTSLSKRLGIKKNSEEKEELTEKQEKDK